MNRAVPRDSADAAQRLTTLWVLVVFLSWAKITQAREVVQPVAFHAWSDFSEDMSIAKRYFTIPP